MGGSGLSVSVEKRRSLVSWGVEGGWRRGCYLGRPGQGLPGASGSLSRSMGISAVIVVLAVQNTFFLGRVCHMAPSPSGCIEQEGGGVQSRVCGGS